MAVGVAIGTQMAGALGGVTASPSVVSGGVAAEGAAADVSPPPLPSGLSLFVAIDGKQAGPFDMAALQAQVAAGKLGQNTLV
ncbi:MAG: DUF4339 domain-containing protein [Gemmataceae bacterium]